MPLLLTVGTGTAGKNSNLAAGLVNSIANLPELPSLAFLVPSLSADSIAVAELVAGESPCPVEIAPPEYRIARADDLLCSRVCIRGSLKILMERFPGKQILVNPTSGTKQMTIGCFLAASENPGVRLCFIGGKRQDGVVITGTEENLFFEPNLLHRERALAIAEQFYQTGALEAIRPLLLEFGEYAAPESALGFCQSERQALRFEQARQAATQSDHPKLIPLRSYLEKVRDAGRTSSLFVAEVFCGAERLRKWGKDAASYLSYYQSVELAARCALAVRHSIHEPYDTDLIINAPYWTSTQRKRLEANARNGTLRLGLHQLHETLNALGDPCGQSFLENRPFRSLLDRRNEFSHLGLTPDPELLETFALRARNHLLELLPDIDLDLPCRLWSNTLLS